MKILLVDDHAILLESLALMLTQLLPGADVSTAGDGQAALRLAAECPNLDLLVLDLLMPGIDGIGFLRHVRKVHPALPVMILSSSVEPGDVRQAIEAGAQGYVPKSAGPQTLLSAIRVVLQGDIYIPPFVLSDAASAPVSRDLGLSPRQTDVLRHLAAGASNKEIGRALGLSEKTVKVHVVAIFHKLGVTRRMHAAERARQASLI